MSLTYISYTPSSSLEQFYIRRGRSVVPINLSKEIINSYQGTTRITSSFLELCNDLINDEARSGTGNWIERKLICVNWYFPTYYLFPEMHKTHKHFALAFVPITETLGFVVNHYEIRSILNKS